MPLFASFTSYQIGGVSWVSVTLQNLTNHNTHCHTSITTALSYYYQILIIPCKIFKVIKNTIYFGYPVITATFFSINFTISWSMTWLEVRSYFCSLLFVVGSIKVSDTVHCTGCTIQHHVITQYKATSKCKSLPYNWIHLVNDQLF